jgi:hypothetical protein
MVAPSFVDAGKPKLGLGMGRAKSKRQRILDHVEIRALWGAADDVGYDGLVRLLLLMAQRREKVVTMQRSDIREGTWNIPTEPGEKANAEILQLPNVASTLSTHSLLLPTTHTCSRSQPDTSHFPNARTS